MVTTTIVQACIIKRVVDKNGLGGLTVGATTFEFLGANAVVEKKKEFARWFGMMVGLFDNEATLGR